MSLLTNDRRRIVTLTKLVLLEIAVTFYSQTICQEIVLFIFSFENVILCYFLVECAFVNQVEFPGKKTLLKYPEHNVQKIIVLLRTSASAN